MFHGQCQLPTTPSDGRRTDLLEGTRRIFRSPVVEMTAYFGVAMDQSPVADLMLTRKPFAGSIAPLSTCRIYRPCRGRLLIALEATVRHERVPATTTTTASSNRRCLCPSEARSTALVPPTTVSSQPAGGEHRGDEQQAGDSLLWKTDATE